MKKMMPYAVFAVAVYLIGGHLYRHYAMQQFTFDCGVITNAERVPGDYWTVTYAYLSGGECVSTAVHNRLDDSPLPYQEGQLLQVRVSVSDPTRSTIAKIDSSASCERVRRCLIQ